MEGTPSRRRLGEEIIIKVKQTENKNLAHAPVKVKIQASSRWLPDRV
jgi:hypothetical protein